MIGDGNTINHLGTQMNKDQDISAEHALERVHALSKEIAALMESMCTWTMIEVAV